MKILYLPNEYSQQRQREKRRWIYPVHLAMEATYFKKLGHHVVWGLPFNAIDKVIMGTTLMAEIMKGFNKIVIEPGAIPFSALPPADRILTNAFDKRYQYNGNFKYRPGTYIQSASGCWWGKCSFCVEKGKRYIVRDVNAVYNEILECKRLGFREVFDDSATFPTGKWLDDLLSKPSPGIPISCNMRMVDVDYERMKAWGFRMVLFGIESANQITLDKINKGTTISDIHHVFRAYRAGLEPHGAFMFGYPWETEKEARTTLFTALWLLRKGILKTAQASFYNPPNGNNNPNHRKYVKKIYGVWKYPDFWFNKLKDLRSFDDVVYLYRQVREALR